MGLEELIHQDLMLIEECFAHNHVGGYELSARPLISALRRAGERGIEVRLLLDEEVLREHPQDRALAGVRHISLRTLGGRAKRRSPAWIAGAMRCRSGGGKPSKSVPVQKAP